MKLELGELNALLLRARALQDDIDAVVESPTVSSVVQLVPRIDSLNSDVKRQLLSPSLIEESELGLVMVNLARIVRNLSEIKHVQMSHLRNIVHAGYNEG